MSTSTLHRQFQIGPNGAPGYVPATESASNLVRRAESVVYMEGWESLDGEELSVLVLRDGTGTMIGALPAPPPDDAWFDAFEAADTLVVFSANSQPRNLHIYPG